MDKAKPKKTGKKSNPNAKIEEPDFLIKSEVLSTADRKLQAQKERDRKDAEETGKLSRKEEKTEQKKKNNKKISKQNRNKISEKNEKPIQVNNEKTVANVQKISANKTKTEDNIIKMDPTSPRENIARPNFSSSVPNRSIKTDNYLDSKTPPENRAKQNYSSPFPGRSIGNSNNYNYNFNDGKKDKEFQEFLRCAKKSNGKIREEYGDLFDAPDEYSLAHCVAEDFSMGAGIAKEFKKRFKHVAKLLDQNAQTGGLAILKNDSRFIYYLVTKKVSRGKPTLYTLWQSLLKLRDHIAENKVSKLAIPQIGCGLDRLNWNEVKDMVGYIFDKIEIDIVVYILEYNANETPTPSRPLKECIVVHEVKPLVEIESQTGLIFFGTEDSFISPEIEHLATKYDFLQEYRIRKKSTGDVMKLISCNEYLYGLIVRPTRDDPINFAVFERCLHNLERQLKVDRTEYIGLQGFVEKDDEVITEKLVNLMKYHLKNVEIWICWPRELAYLCPFRK